jgi:hypothetical protein
MQAGGYRPLDRTVNVQVGRLPRRLAGAFGSGDGIEAVLGEGYAIELPGADRTEIPDA